MRFNRHTCYFCHRVYEGDGHKGHCTSECHARKAYKEKFPYELERRTFKCENCGEAFKTGYGKKKYCSQDCRNAKLETKPHVDKIKQKNEEWLANSKKKKKGLPLHVLNRMAEWKRVWDDESWTRRFNGRRM